MKFLIASSLFLLSLSAVAAPTNADLITKWTGIAVTQLASDNASAAQAVVGAKVTLGQGGSANVVFVDSKGGSLKYMCHNMMNKDMCMPM